MTIEHELVTIKRNQEMILKLLMPKEWTIPKIAEITGRTPQAVRDWLLNNAEPDKDFFKKGGKIIVSESAALTYINKRR